MRERKLGRKVLCVLLFESCCQLTAQLESNNLFNLSTIPGKMRNGNIVLYTVHYTIYMHIMRIEGKTHKTSTHAKEEGSRFSFSFYLDAYIYYVLLPSLNLLHATFHLPFRFDIYNS